MKKILFFCLILMALQSCKTTKVATPESKVEEQKLMVFKQNYTNKLAKFDYLQIKAKVNAELKGKSNSANLKLYFQKNDLIWANASLLGITGARAKITPGNVQAYEILDKTYINSDFGYFNQMLKVDFITFDRLKQLLLGQLFLIADWDEYEVETTSDNQYALKYRDNTSLKNNPKEGEYIHTFYLDANMNLSKVAIYDNSTKTSITVDYENWQNVQGKNLPQIVKVLINSDQTDRVVLEYNNFDFTSMEAPFNIPNNYKERKF